MLIITISYKKYKKYIVVVIIIIIKDCFYF